MLSYHPGERPPLLRPDTWIITVSESGINHYSWEQWVPTLECLKVGPSFYEATISWTDVDIQLKRLQAIEQKRFNDRVRQFFLEKYGQKVLGDQKQDSVIALDVFRRFFFRRKNEDREEQPINDNSKPSTADYSFDHADSESEENKDTFVVSWEPEAGGLMGNQVADSTSAQISLLPGTKYLVRIASNEGPGSSPIEVDTRPDSVQVVWLKKNSDKTMVAAILFAVLLSLMVMFTWAVARLFRSRQAKTVENV